MFTLSRRIFVFGVGFILTGYTYPSVQTKKAFESVNAKSPSNLTVILMMRFECPCNERCIDDLNYIADHLKPACKFIGVVNAPKTSIPEYTKLLKPTFDLVSDPEGKAIQNAGGKYSFDMVLLNKNHEIIKFWQGYNRDHIAELVKLVNARQPKKLSFDLSKLPIRVTSGCPFKSDY